MTNFGNSSLGNTRFAPGVRSATAQTLSYKYDTQKTTGTTVTTDTANQTISFFVSKPSVENASVTDLARTASYSILPLVSPGFPDIKLWGAQGIILVTGDKDGF